MLNVDIKNAGNIIYRTSTELRANTWKRKMNRLHDGRIRNLAIIGLYVRDVKPHIIAHEHAKRKAGQETDIKRIARNYKILNIDFHCNFEKIKVATIECLPSIQVLPSILNGTSMYIT